MSMFRGLREGVERMAENKRKGALSAVQLAKLDQMGYDVNQTPYGLFGSRTHYEVNRRPEANQLTAGQKIAQFKTSQQFGVDPITGRQLGEHELYEPRFGYQDDDLSSLMSRGTVKPGMPKPSPSSLPARLSPREHYNQLRASGYSVEDARQLAGV